MLDQTGSMRVAGLGIQLSAVEERAPRFFPGEHGSAAWGPPHFPLQHWSRGG